MEAVRPFIIADRLTLLKNSPWQLAIKASTWAYFSRSNDSVTSGIITGFSFTSLLRWKKVKRMETAEVIIGNYHCCLLKSLLSCEPTTFDSLRKRGLHRVIRVWFGEITSGNLWRILSTMAHAGKFVWLSCARSVDLSYLAIIPWARVGYEMVNGFIQRKISLSGENIFSLATIIYHTRSN